MLSIIRQQIFTNWHPMRWVALAIGLFFGYSWIMHSEAFSGLLSLFFLFQAVTNTGCLAGQCAPRISGADKTADEVSYNEVKNQ